MQTRRKKFLARSAVVAAAAAILAFAWTLYLVRDPGPYFAARRGTVASSTSDAPRLDGDHQREDVRVVSTSGLAVELSIRRPVDDPSVRDAVRRPLFVLLGGHATGREAIELVRDTRGSVVAALSYPLEGSTRIKGFGVVLAAPRIRRAMRDTPPAVQLALDWLIDRPYVDRSRIELVGVSLGAPFACIAGALDERFTRVWALHGAGEVRALIDHNLERKIGFAPARAAVAGLAYVAIGGAAMSPERFVPRIAPREFLMVNGSDDEKLPRACVESLFAAAHEPKELSWRPGRHVEPKRTEIVQELLDVVLGRVR